MKNILKNIGVMTVTGGMAIFGFIAGLLTFRPECITFKNNKNVEESK